MSRSRSEEAIPPQGRQEKRLEADAVQAISVSTRFHFRGWSQRNPGKLNIRKSAVRKPKQYHFLDVAERTNGDVMAGNPGNVFI
jgi:hypothetical protein